MIMEDNSQSNKRIAKNTIFLYLRMMVVMIVALYTSRVVLNTLGVSDYGIYNVVGGIVTIVGFLNSALAGSTSRFLTFALGTGDKIKQKNTFAASLNLHLALAALVLILGETVGLWFFYEKMIIPEDRMQAAFFVYQFSIITTMISFTQVPYNSSLIAHERMSIYAYVGLYEAFSKLLIVYLLIISPIDKLVFYALLLMINNMCIQLFYRYYVVKHYEECHFQLVRDKQLYKQLLGYSGWDLFGNLAVVCQSQGVNIVLNLFFGPVVNAARAIAVQIQGAITQFVGNFMTAVRPQVIKNYAEGNNDKMFSLTFYTAKFSYMLMLVFVIPLCLEINFVLRIWLGDGVPENTALFAVLVLVTYTWRTFHIAALMPYHAIGKIKTGNVIIGTLMILTLPVGYVLFKFGYPQYCIFLVILFVELIGMFAIYWLIHNYVYFPYKFVFTKILIPSALVTIATIVLPLFLHFSMAEGWLRLVCVTLTSEVSLLFACLFLGLNNEERNKILTMVKSKIKKS